MTTVFLVLLRFGDNKAAAAEHLAAHNAWIQRGFDDGTFLVVGNIQPGVGGAILAHGGTRSSLEQRVAEDPFVAERVVIPEIIEIAPNMTDERLRFLAA
jgi:uncharacterized protein YciI